jgi:hypothetical protein
MPAPNTQPSAPGAGAAAAAIDEEAVETLTAIGFAEGAVLEAAGRLGPAAGVEAVANALGPGDALGTWMGGGGAREVDEGGATFAAAAAAPEGGGAPWHANLSSNRRSRKGQRVAARKAAREDEARGTADHAGWLMLREFKPRRLNAHPAPPPDFKRRWCELHGGRLSYYGRTGVTKAKGQLDLRARPPRRCLGVTATARIPARFDVTFMITPSDSAVAVEGRSDGSLVPDRGTRYQTLVFDCPGGPEECASWVAALQRAQVILWPLMEPRRLCAVLKTRLSSSAPAAARRPANRPAAPPSAARMGVAR